MADDINLPNLVSHLAVNLDGVSGAVGDAARQGSAMGSALGTGINRQLDDLLRHLPQVTIDGDSDPLDRDLARIHRELAQLDSQRIGVDISIPDALRQLEELEANLQRLGDEHHDVNVRAATAAAARQLEELRAAARRVDDTDVDIDVDVDTDGPNRLTAVLRNIPAMAGRAAGALAGVGKATAAIGAAVPLVASVVTTLANIAPAAGVAVTGLAAVKLAQGTVKLAAVGMDDALSAALDPSKAEEFAEALEKLSPEARKFAQAVKDAAPALRQLQQDVQDRVFDGLAEKLERTGKVVLPIFRRSLLDSGTALNDMASGVLDAARDLGESGALGKALDSASKGLRNLSGVPGIVVKSLGQIAAAAGPSFEKLTEKAAKAAEGLGKRLTEAFESGRMEEAIEEALDLLGQLWDIGGNVVEIFRQIFGAAPEGGGLLDALETITGTLAEIAGQEDVQSALRTLFETISLLAETAAPLLAEALEMIAPVLEDLGPPLQELIESLGESLKPLMDDLGPVVREFGGVLKEAALAIAPLLPPIAELIEELLPALKYFLRGTAVIIREVIAPALEMFVVGLEKIIEWLSLLVDWLVGKAADGVRQFAQLLRGDFSSASDSANRSIADMSIGVARNISGLPGKVVGSTASFVSILKDAGARAKNGLIIATAELVAGVRNKISELPGVIARQVAGMINLLPQAGRDLIRGFISGIRSMIPDVQGVLSSITSMIPQFKGPPAKDAKLLTPAGRLLIEGFIRGINESTAKLRARLESITKALPANVRSGVGKSLAAATRELQKQVTKRDQVFKQLAAVEKKIKDLISARDKTRASITKGILDDANITSGHSDVNSVTAITIGLQQALKNTREFQANLDKLRKAGLRNDLLQQIAEAGVDAGGATAAALARATPAELKKINDLQAMLAKSATATGNTVGDALYQAGLRAAQGLLAGLRSQEGAIERQMRRIATGMLTTVKKAHKTHSPSRAFWEIGEMDGEGLRGGLLATAGRVRDAARSVAGAALDVASGVGGALTGTPTAQQLAAVYAGGSGGGSDTYNINMYGAQATPAELVRELSWRGLVRRG